MKGKKYALFIVGERNSGKSTLIRSLTNALDFRGLLLCTVYFSAAPRARLPN
jgi:polynucleotide 5'-kinase involved in rRNA processing